MDMQKLRVFICVALTAIIAPMGALAIDIGGPGAADWVNAGTTEGIGVTLVAIPANEPAHTYSGSGPDPVFDATDRDTVCCGASAPFGLGVMNTLISNGQPGVTSKPSEIGFYQNPAICGDGKPLGNHCSDALHVNLDQTVTGGNVKVAFFYGSEQAGETLQVELYNNGIMVAGATQGPAGNGAYGGGNPGFYTFPLGDVCWNEIRFLGDNANVADATDYLVEGIADLRVCEVTVPPEVSFTQGFFGSSPVGEALVAGLINDDNCADINTILTSIGALEGALDCAVPAEATASALAHFLTGQVGAGRERAPDIGFLPSGFEPGDNLAAQKITLLINMELEAGINTGNFLNIDVVNGIDPLLTTGGQLGACDDLLPLDPLGPDGICDAGTVVINTLGDVVVLLDAQSTTVGDVLAAVDAYIELYGDVIDPADTIAINGIDVTVGQATKILGLINESYDAGTITGFVTVTDLD